MHLSALTYEQLAGQRFMVGFDGTTFNDDLQFLIGTLNIGGVILFTRNTFHPTSCARCVLPFITMVGSQDSRLC